MTRIRRAAAVVAVLSLTVTPIGSAFAQSGVATDDAFLEASHQGNLAEIAAGEDAEAHATTDCVRQVGSLLVRDHTRLDGEITTLADTLGVSLPDAPSEEQQQALADVQAKAGTPAYDEAWLRSQETAHRETLELIDTQIASGTNAEITAAAEAARPVVATHLDLVRDGVCHAPEAADGNQAATNTGTDSSETAALAGALGLAPAMVWTARTRRPAGAR